MGLDFDKALPPRAAFEHMIRVLKPGALAFVMSSPRQDVLWRMLAMLEGVGFQLRQSFISWIYKTGFPKAMDVSKGIDRKLGLDREDLGENPNIKGRTRKWRFDDKETNDEIIRNRGLSVPVSDLAKKWEGWKSQTGLKPAAECILMVNKPRNEPTIVDNVLRWGTGAINVDACRIPFQNEGDSQLVESKHDSVVGLSTPRANTYNWRKFEGVRTNGFTPKGRFPANLLISDGALDTGKTTKSAGGEEIAGQSIGGRGIYRGGDERAFFHYYDEGSPYRYFDLDAWAEHHGFLDVAKPSRAERNLGLYNMPEGPPPGSKRSKPAEGRKNPLGEPRANFHPCVKPIKLMAYLITLGCPPKGIVVDPFVGSGTTCIAAKRLRRKWIGIEINPEYVDIARARIDIKGPLDQYLEAEK